LNKSRKIGYGLIGYPLSHSLSEKYFRDKFHEEKITGRDYSLFPISDLSAFPSLIENNPELAGLNVTIPFKEKIIPFLSEIDPKAGEIGAVNTIVILREGTKVVTRGYNTDEDGFRLSTDFSGFSRAFILGTGGSSRAVGYALRKLGIPVTRVSRQPAHQGILNYEQFQACEFNSPTLIVNTTPVGMFPDEDACPQIPFERLNPQVLLYDLIYNPVQTLFLKQGVKYGAKVKNGLDMLRIQAEESYRIWNKG
jgi:shikimate dehydrogenase